LRPNIALCFTPCTLSRTVEERVANYSNVVDWIGERADTSFVVRVADQQAPRLSVCANVMVGKSKQKNSNDYPHAHLEYSR
jgi:hypothetical protein